MNQYGSAPPGHAGSAHDQPPPQDADNEQSTSPHAFAPTATVLRTREVCSWPKHERGDQAHVLPLGRALTRTYRTDAHFTQYTTPIGRRLGKEAVDHGIEGRLTFVAFDVDCPEVHGTSEPAPASWRAQMRESVRELAAVHPDPYFYETRGGARILYTLPEPTIIRTSDDADAWKRDYAIALAYFERRFGIVADPACADWPRLFRLPHATREGASAPEDWPTVGDASRIGALSIDAIAADVARAKQILPRAFGPKRVLDFTPRTFDFAPRTFDGFGLLYHLLCARGAILGEKEPGVCLVRCPREKLHTTGRTGDGSTLLYPPARGKELGCINCLHAHCSALTVRDWLGEFSTVEVEAARRAAGIGRA